MPATKPTILATSMGFNRARDPWQPSPIFRYAFDLTDNTTHPEYIYPGFRTNTTTVRVTTSGWSESIR